MDTGSDQKQSRLHSVLYVAENTKIFCTIKLSQRTGSDPSVIVHSPDSRVPSALYRIESLSTTHTIQVSSIQNASYVDYVNAIALCLLKSGIQTDIITGASEGSSYMFYCAASDTIRLSYIEGSEQTEIMSRLRDKCTAELERIKAM